MYLRPVVRVRHRRPLGWTPTPDGHLQRIDDELGSDVIGNGPADHDAGEGVEDDGHVELALLGGVLGHVHDPQLVGLGGVKGPVHEIVCRLGVGVASGASMATAAIDAADPGLGHEPLDPFSAAVDPFAETQLGMHTRRPIGTPAHAPDVDDHVRQVGVLEVLVAHRVGLPGIEA